MERILSSKDVLRVMNAEEAQSISLNKITNLFELEDVKEGRANFQEKFLALANYISYLIHADFSKLLSILYRIDISENKLKKALSENKEEPAGIIIAQLLIEREREKIISREKYKGL